MFLARKELWFSKKRFLLIGFIIVLIAWLVFMLSGLGNGLSDLGTATIRYSEMELAIFEEEAEFSLSKSTLSESLIEEITQLEGVEEAAGIATAAGALVLGSNGETSASETDSAETEVSGSDSTDTETSETDSTDTEVSGKKTTVFFVGIEPGSFLEPATVSGQALASNSTSTTDSASASNEATRVLVDTSLQDEGFTLGDVVTLSGVGTEFEIGGFVANEKLNHLPVVYVPLETLREFKYLVPGSDMGIDKPVNAIFLKGNKLDREAISQALGGVEVADKKDTLNGVPGYQAENSTISMMLGLLVFISAFVIAVFFYVLTTQKVQQFGVMKAIGASNGFVIKTVVSQVFLLSAVSILIGIGLTYLTTLVLPAGMPFNLLPELVVTYGLILLVTSMIGSLFSIRSIIKIDPITALGRVE